MARLSERDFTLQVLEVAKRYGWSAVHFETSQGRRGEFRTTYRGDGKGFPDIVAVKAGRVLFAELKIPPNKQTAQQIAWAEAISLSDAEYYLWTPDDWAEIEKTLRPSECPW